MFLLFAWCNVAVNPLHAENIAGGIVHLRGDDPHVDPNVVAVPVLDTELDTLHDAIHFNDFADLFTNTDENVQILWMDELAQQIDKRYICELLAISQTRYQTVWHLESFRYRIVRPQEIILWVHDEFSGRCGGSSWRTAWIGSSLLVSGGTSSSKGSWGSDGGSWRSSGGSTTSTDTGTGTGTGRRSHRSSQGCDGGGWHRKAGVEKSPISCIRVMVVVAHVEGDGKFCGGGGGGGRVRVRDCGFGIVREAGGRIHGGRWSIVDGTRRREELHER